MLFEIWQATGNIAEACAIARVSLSLFYYWKPRFDEAGYAGLEAFESRTAHHLNTKAEAIQQQANEYWAAD